MTDHAVRAIVREVMLTVAVALILGGGLLGLLDLSEGCGRAFKSEESFLSSEPLGCGSERSLFRLPAIVLMLSGTIMAGGGALVGAPVRRDEG